MGFWRELTRQYCAAAPPFHDDRCEQQSTSPTLRKKMVTRSYSEHVKPGRCSKCNLVYDIFYDNDEGCPPCKLHPRIHGDVIHNAHVPTGPRPSSKPDQTKWEPRRVGLCGFAHYDDIECPVCILGINKEQKKVDKPPVISDNNSIGVTDMLDIAISITAQAFEGKTDKGGVPYVMHCLHVMSEVRKQFRKDTDLQCIAMLHDIVEDTDWTLDRLREKGFSARVVRGVEVLTHEGDISYDDYIKRIGMYEDARQVKMADLRHNSDIMRIKGLTKKDFERMEKYQRSYHYLSK